MTGRETEERRITRRHRMQFGVEWTPDAGEAPRAAGTLNVSVSGALIWLEEDPPAIGSQLDVRLMTRESEPIVLRAQVRWAGRHRGRAVVGIALDAEESAPDMLQTYLKAISARLRRRHNLSRARRQASSAAL